MTPQLKSVGLLTMMKVGLKERKVPMISTQLGTTPIIYCIYCISDKIIYVFFIKIHGFSTKHFSFSMLDLKEIFTPKFLP